MNWRRNWKLYFEKGSADGYTASMDRVAGNQGLISYTSLDEPGGKGVDVVIRNLEALQEHGTRASSPTGQYEYVPFGAAGDVERNRAIAGPWYHVHDAVDEVYPIGHNGYYEDLILNFDIQISCTEDGALTRNAESVKKDSHLRVRFEERDDALLKDPESMKIPGKR